MADTIRQSFRVGFAFPVVFTRDAFRPDNGALRDVFRSAGPKVHRVLVALDAGLRAADPSLTERLRRYADAHRDTFELVGPPLHVRGGERCKNEPGEVERIHACVAKLRIDRHSFLLAIGGGAVLDTVGYAAATAHRGVRLVRMPSTVLAQDDAGVGVKNGVNAFGRKNFLGCFAPPFAVVNDLDLLRTLSPRDRRAGMSEAVKVAAIKDAAFLDWLHRERHALAAFAPEAVERLVVRCAELHLEHVRSEDPFEQGSGRPLDFGHWSAHKLEELTQAAVRHGEAVAIGCALDSLYAHRRGLLDEVSLGRLLQTLEDLGFELYHPALAELDVARALEEFREHLGGDLCVTLPDGLGRRVEVREVDVGLMRRCVETLGERHARRPERRDDGDHDGDHDGGYDGGYGDRRDDDAADLPQTGT